MCPSIAELSHVHHPAPTHRGASGPGAPQREDLCSNGQGCCPTGLKFGDAETHTGQVEFNQQQQLAFQQQRVQKHVSYALSVYMVLMYMIRSCRQLPLTHHSLLTAHVYYPRHLSHQNCVKARTIACQSRRSEPKFGEYNVGVMASV